MSKDDMERAISDAIVSAYYEQLRCCLTNDVVVAGAGPSGLMAAYVLAKNRRSVTVVEKRLSPGGGIWGGGMMMSKIVLPRSATDLLVEFGIRYAPWGEEFCVVDAMEFGSSLCFHAVKAGARLLNLHTVEDVRVIDGRVTGVVVNRTSLGEALPVDPIVLAARAVLDATGHDAAVVSTLARRGIIDLSRGVGEGPMDAKEGERFVVERAGMIFPGLYVAGMSVCTCFGGPRMGPIFGGMLSSGKRVAELIAKDLGSVQAG